ncbi:beta clamp domain-containing protein [Robiginitalea biformata]|uniref:Beta sliding clamp n=1 Tax=Robiginitalea biformata (strain ATCC BAA-864 / DSM 15991 / KCTC 12146 / HTCC2501) TaxID=313596 RepID=A4CKM8_ROBBH|nr:DNA polymerase III subunit beta [Robiginitalea biformata]EAR15427.1 DNA polymerase III subunit beta [Robiginitalea biformata HTCC2501]
MSTIEINSRALLGQLNRLSGLINNTLPVLSHVKVETQKGHVFMTASNLETTASVLFEAKCKPGSITCIPHNTLSSILKNLPDAPVSITIESDGVIQNAEIVCGDADYKLPGLPPDDFPRIAEHPWEEKIELEAAHFLQTLKTATRFTDQTDELSGFQNIILDAESGYLEVMAMTRHLLFKRQITKAKKKFMMMVTTKAATYLASGAFTSEKIKLSEAKNMLLITGDNIAVHVRQPEWKPPQYQLLFSKDRVQHGWEANTEELKTKLSRLLSACQSRFAIADFDMKKDRTTLKIEDEAYATRGQEIVPAELTGSAVKVRYQIATLQLALSVVEEERVKLEFQAANTATFIDTENTKMLVMPSM